jgi:hypothetical protein
MTRRARAEESPVAEPEDPERSSFTFRAASTTSKSRAPANVAGGGVLTLNSGALQRVIEKVLTPQSLRSLSR